MSSVSTRKIGNVDVSAVGYGAMSIAGTMYSPGKILPDEERFEVSPMLCDVRTNTDAFVHQSRYSMQLSVWDAQTGTQQMYIATLRT